MISLLPRREIPFVSVIVLNFNGKGHLERCLASLLKTKYSNFEVILVDNASTDSSLKFAQETYGNNKQIKIVKNNRNIGFSGGNNVGFKFAKGSFIVFLNNDTLVDPDWLTPLINAMEEDKTIGLAQSMLLEIDGEEIQTAGSLLSDYLIIQRILLEGKPSNVKVPSFFESSYACGASMIIRRELINEIGLFDPKIPFYYDDTLLSLKTWLAGKRVVTVSKSRVRHARGATLIWRTYFTTFNQLRAYVCLMFDVYFNLGALIKSLFIFSIAFLTNLLFVVRRKNLAIFSANIRAIGWVLRNLKHVWSNRLEHWRRAKIPSSTLLAKFIRIKLPASIYLMPYKMASAHYNNMSREYENKLIQTAAIKEP